jgi:hypothetical protein
VRYNSQRTITAQTARIGLADESVYLQGSEAQTVRIDGSGAGAASPGASFRLINSSAHDATFIPDSPQTVAGGTSLVIPARSSRTTEPPALDGGVCDAGEAAICR